MRTIFIIAGIVLAGATIITVVQSDKKKDSPEVHHEGDGHGHPADLPATPSASPTINPAHGLPGHRCDLPVGAPINANSGVAAPVQNPPTIKMNPVPAQSAPQQNAPAPSAAGVKINPAHGMPGHRCDIEVGAPLT
ncbi:MAG: hypothetical protein WBJ10_00645 [Daejeonella sp.]|uniref:hypothetical protein n=1 Tax=Daejeonella sp. TaxID=2805397 RepID=UPI003C72F3BC